MIKRSHLSIFQFKSITHRLIFGCITAAIAISGISYLHGRYLIQKLFGSWLIDLSQLRIDATTNEIEGKLLRIEKDVFAFRQSMQGAGQNLNPSQTELLPRLNKLLEQQPQIQAITLINIPHSKSPLPNRNWQYNRQGKSKNLSDGEALFWLNRCPSVPKYASSTNQTVMYGNDWAVPYFSERAPKATTIYCLPLEINSNASPSSVIVIEVNLDWLPEFMKQKLANSEVVYYLDLVDIFIAIPSTQSNQQWLVQPHNPQKIQSWLSRQPLSEQNRGLVNTQFNPQTNFLANYQDTLITKAAPSTGWIVGVELDANRLESASQQYIWLMTASMFRDIGLMCVVIALIMQITTRSLRDLNASTEEMAKGNLDTVLPPVTSVDEVGRLTQSFRRMRDSLQIYIKDLQETTAAKQKLESELSIAAQIQRTMLPRTNIDPSSPYDISAVLKPARIVGGDLYDFFLLGSDRLCLIIGDVADKGFPSALQMARTITLIHTLTKPFSTPSEILSTVNQELCIDNEECQFVTVFCAILELDTGKFTYTSGGHDAPILVRDRHVQYLDLDTSPPLGLYEDAIFVHHELILIPNDLVLFYTDGITEAMNLDGEFFSDTRLFEVIASYPPTNATKAVRTIQHFCQQFVGNAPQSDDMTILALQYLPLSPFLQTENIMEWNLVINSELTELEYVRQKLYKILDDVSLPVELIENTQLIVEEVLVNIIQYGYDDRQNGHIDVRLEIANGQKLTITFVDGGKPFNPLIEIAPPDLERNDEERSNGGLGFFLVQELADQIDYAYRDGKNILTVRQAILS